MFRLDAEKPIRLCSGITRRDFLHAGALPLAGLALPSFLAARADAARRGEAHGDVNCILIFMLGGPSQLDTWDPKPDASSEVRGPFKPMETNVSGIRISEIFPRLAQHADKYSLIRSLHHNAPAVHDTGHQLMQTGRLFAEGVEHPHVGAVLSSLKGSRSGAPSNVVLPTPIGATGGNMPHGQSAGYLGSRHEPLVLASDPNHADFQSPELVLSEPFATVRGEQRETLRASIERGVAQFERSEDARLQNASFHKAFTRVISTEARAAYDLTTEPEALRESYGRNRFGQSCLLARRLVESGTRFVTINMFETVFNELSWDCHGSKPFTPLSAYRESVGPWFDHGLSTLLGDLSARGILENTLVVAMGEFGRTPKLNPAGGRDHWPQCSSMLFAGGGVRGGQVIGASDAIGGAPAERPVSPAEVAATIYHAVGVPLDHQLPGPDGALIRVTDEGVKPIRELF